MASNTKVCLIGMLGWGFCVLSFESQAVELPKETFSLLASDQFSVREKAQKDLLIWSRKHREAAIDELFRQSKQADDPEVRQRSLAVLQELVNDDYLKDGEGYVGILMMDERSNVPGDEKPRSVIRVSQVVPGTAGEQAGLKPNDLIAGMNEDIWRDVPASLSFGEKIRKLKPGTKVMLKIVRDGNLQDIEIKLGKRPFTTNQLFINPEIDMELLEKKAKDDFFRQWMNQRKVESPLEKP